MNFTVYKSSAGSGKTYTLVKEYLKLALSDTRFGSSRFKKILAITFTNKAADEMKSRVLKSLFLLSTNSSEQLSSVIQAETKLKPDSIQKKAKETLINILHNYSDFSISTIDSFTHKIIQSFAHDLNIPTDFEVELDSKSLLNKAIEELLKKIGVDKLVTEILLQFAEEKLMDEKSWHIESDLLQIAYLLHKEDSAANLNKLKNLSANDFIKTGAIINENIKKYEATISEIASKAINSINTAQVSIGSFYYSKAGIGNYFLRLKNKEIEKIVPNSYVKSTINEDKWYGKNTAAEEIEKINGIKNDLYALYKEIEKEYESGYSKYIIHNLIKKNIYSLALLSEIETILDELKNEKKLIHISEFNKLIFNIIQEQPTPFIYEKIGKKFSNFLIDEFQDTSVLQWQNILPLIENSISENNYSMIVGDAKQAVYRWRGGNIQQFTQLPFIRTEDELIKERELALVTNYNEQHLEYNYRSTPEIVHFNNQLYNHLSSKLSYSYKKVYTNSAQKTSSIEKGYVAIEFIEDKKDYNNNVFAKTLNIIKSCLQKQFELLDIAIITRDNKEGNNVASFLIQNNIPVISSESLLLRNSHAINFIINVLSYVYDQQNEIAEYAVQNFISQLNIFIKPANKQIQLNTLTINLKRIQKKNIYEQCESVIKLFRLEEILPEEKIYFQFFLDEVFTLSEKSNNSFNAFMEWWEDKKEKLSISTPQNSNAISVMTIHKSKGLEFPIVILPFCNWKTTESRDLIWINVKENTIPNLNSAIVPLKKDLELTAYNEQYQKEKDQQLLDNINLLYVATTRAVKQLHVFSSPSKNENSISGFLIDFLQNTNQWEASKLLYSFGIQETNNKVKKSQKLDTNFFKYKASSGIISSNKLFIKKETEKSFDKLYGIHVHSVLSQIQSIKTLEEDLKNIEKLPLESSVKESLYKKLKSIFGITEIQSFFSEKYTQKIEREIISTDGSIYRPDRVFINENTVVVIDFKTGIESSSHINQLNTYEKTLKNMGLEKIEKYILYIESEKLLKL